VRVGGGGLCVRVCVCMVSAVANFSQFC
jgi:hypothetical protein